MNIDAYLADIHTAAQAMHDASPMANMLRGDGKVVAAEQAHATQLLLRAAGHDNAKAMQASAGALHGAYNMALEVASGNQAGLLCEQFETLAAPLAREAAQGQVEAQSSVGGNGHVAAVTASRAEAAAMVAGGGSPGA